MTDGDVPRDRWKRPLIVPPHGGDPVPYTRTTTLVGAIDDTHGLMAWKSRMTALGLSVRPDLLLSVTANRDDKRELDAITEKAQEAAGAGNAANTGSALHILTEAVDRGEKLPPLPDSARRDLDAFRRATAPLEVVAIEKFVVNDEVNAAGTTDRIYRLGGQLFIGDTKTGSIELGILKIAAQLATYARSKGYDITTGARHDLGVSLDWGLIVHLPAGKATCTIHWVNLQIGWQAAQLALAVRELRKTKFDALTSPFATAQEAA